MAQWQAAPLRSKYLKAMVPRVGYSNLYHNWVYTGGAFQLAFNLKWGAIQMHTRTNQAQYLWMPESNHLSSLQWHLPLNTMAEAAGRNSRVLEGLDRPPQLRRLLAEHADRSEAHYADDPIGPGLRDGRAGSTCSSSRPSTTSWE